MVNVGLSYLVTLGNEAMITAGHVLDYLVDDPGTRAVAVFMETVRDPETFRRAARRAAQAGKAIVVLKAGSSALSARTAAAHTGALVGDDRVIDAVFADLGVIRVDSIEDMLITAGAAAALGRLDRPGIGIVSISGGACDIVADRADDLGAALPELAPATRDALAAIMPAYGTVQNPLDVTGAAIIDPANLHPVDRGHVRRPVDRRRRRRQQHSVDRYRPALPGADVRGRDRRRHAGGLLPGRVHQPGHAAGHRLHAGVDGAGRGAVRHPRAAPGRGGAAQRRPGGPRPPEPRTRRRRPTSGAGARAGPAPREVVRARRPRAARRRGHPGRPGPAGRLGRRGGQGGRRLRRPAVGQDRLRGHPAQERHRRRRSWTSRPARRPSARPTGR